ncbi:11736_t:CDS:1, partial [Funneliformis mosseae]
MFRKSCTFTSRGSSPFATPVSENRGDRKCRAEDRDCYGKDRVRRKRDAPL